MLRSSERAVLVLRGTALVELVLAAGLLALPANPLPRLYRRARGRERKGRDGG